MSNGASDERFLTGKAAEDRLRVVYSDFDHGYVEQLVVGNGVLDLILKDLGIDPATMLPMEGEV